MESSHKRRLWFQRRSIRTLLSLEIQHLLQELACLSTSHFRALIGILLLMDAANQFSTVHVICRIIS